MSIVAARADRRAGTRVHEEDQGRR